MNEVTREFANSRSTLPSLNKGPASRTNLFQSMLEALRFERALALDLGTSNAALPSDLQEVRRKSLALQKAYLTEISSKFFELAKSHWTEASLILFSVFSIVGYWYATLYYAQFDIPIGLYLQGFEDLTLIGFLKDEKPLIVMAALLGWFFVLHYLAFCVGSRPEEPTQIVSSSPRIIVAIAHLLHPVTVAFVIALSIFAIFAPIALGGHSGDRANPSSALQLRMTGAQKPIRIEKLLGSTSDYIFAQLPAVGGQLAQSRGVAFARSRVECIGPERTVGGPAIPSAYDVPPCDGVLVQPPPVACSDCDTPEKTLRNTYRHVIAAQLGCDIAASRPAFFETIDFLDGSASEFDPGTAQGRCSKGSDLRQCMANELQNTLPPRGATSSTEDRIFLLGFASPPQSASYNLDLSERRAEFVRDLVPEWPVRPIEVALGESAWHRALSSRTAKAVLVVSCRAIPNWEDAPLVTSVSAAAALGPGSAPSSAVSAAD